MAKTITVYNGRTDTKTETLTAHTIAGDWAAAKTAYGYKVYHLPTGLSCPVAGPWSVKRLWLNDPRLADAKRVLELVQTVPALPAPVWGKSTDTGWLAGLAAVLKIHAAELDAEKVATETAARS